ncbi:hypothetical protein HYX19_00860 [Candidatus Woesearchaeota archaeon]|nr:hypothetical protein [Candidatus Woesearchaeota archaeon]
MEDVKKFVSSEDIRNNSFKIAGFLLTNEFIPTIIYAVLRGGVYVANPIHEYYLYKGHNVKYGVIRVSSYEGAKKLDEIKIEYIVPELTAIKKEDRILIAEDIIDTRRTITRIIDEIETKTPLRRKPEEALRLKEVVIVANDYKEKEHDDWKIHKKTNPDFYANHWKKEDWVHYTTHELLGLNSEEIKKIYGDLGWK